MSAGQQYQARFEFSSTGHGVLSFHPGDQFTLVSKADTNWWKVRSANGETGLAPMSYLEPCLMRNGGPCTSEAYITLYAYVPQNATQLAFSKGQMLQLVDRTDVSWWTMQTPDGSHEGLVPVNYIEKLDASSAPAPTTSSSSPSKHQALQDKVFDDEGFQQVLASIDSSINHIHDEAVEQGGAYTATQKATLQKLVLHRQNFLSSIVPQALTSNHTISNAFPDHIQSESASMPLGGTTKKDLPSGRSPLLKRHPPVPLSSSPSSSFSLPTKTSPRHSGSEVTRRKGRSAQVARPTQRYSLNIGEGRGTDEDVVNIKSLPRSHFGSLPRRIAPPPPTSTAPHLHSSSTNLSKMSSQNRVYQSLRCPQTKTKKVPGVTALPLSSPSSPIPCLASIAPGELSPTCCPKNSNKTSSGSTPKSPQFHRPRSSSNASTSSRKSTKSLQKSPTSPQKSRTSPQKSPTSLQKSPTSPQKSPTSPQKSPTSPQKLPTSPQLLSSPLHAHSRSNSKDRDRTSPSNSSLDSPRKKLELPTSFTAKEANKLVDLVRNRASVTHYKAQLAVGGVLDFLKEHAPQSAGMIDALINALDQSQNENSVATVSTRHADLERLQEIFFEMRECKDDSQQRSWAIRDDEGAIAALLAELLQILCDANPEVSMVAIMEDKYENILTLITYYQMEPRVSIRLLLLKVFGVMCGLDRTVIGVLLASVLPNELGRDMQQNTVADLQKTLYSCTVCSMIFSTAEAVPLSVYDLWNVDFILFLVDGIESPPPEDFQDQLADSFLNLLLAFNQHFLDPASNLVMKALKRRSNPRNLSEKLMYLVNRGEDPVVISEPCCPDSMTKFLLDVFSDASTSNLFYTTDMRVLIDIVTRQLTDLCPGMETRTHYLELLYRIVGSTDYIKDLHRQRDLARCLYRISCEEEKFGHADKELVRKIWLAYPEVFADVSGL